MLAAQEYSEGIFDGSIQVLRGYHAMISAQPNPGYRLASWPTHPGAGENTSFAINNVLSATSVVAKFEEIAAYKLQLEVNDPCMGYITVDPVKSWYVPSDSVTLRAKNNPGYALRGWRGIAGASNNPTLTVTMDKDMTIRAEFKKSGPGDWQLMEVTTCAVGQPEALINEKFDSCGNRLAIICKNDAFHYEYTKAGITSSTRVGLCIYTCGQNSFYYRMTKDGGRFYEAAHVTADNYLLGCDQGTLNVRDYQ